jgi:hypothetical protein
MALALSMSDLRPPVSSVDALLYLHCEQGANPASCRGGRGGGVWRREWRVAHAVTAGAYCGVQGRTEMTMTNADQAYDDLIEIGARIIAFSDLTGRALPRRVQELISQAADLRGAWNGYSGGGTPGSADLPIVDAVIDEVYFRANAGEVRYTGAIDLGGLAAQMREHLGRAPDRH